MKTKRSHTVRLDPSVDELLRANAKPREMAEMARTGLAWSLPIIIEAGKLRIDYRGLSLKQVLDEIKARSPGAPPPSGAPSERAAS